ncbi:MAG: hypothetical protein O2999_10860 [Nitrospirae bacterium]|nr:hypothetical protein [Nitrospirota bacterium]MDA1304782.1 hypothetical protein [Nitrospirota bacterium]
MNLLRVWPGSIRPIKKKQPRTKSSSKSLLLVAAGSETLPIVNSMDEIRRQAVSMSNYGPAPSTLSPTARPRKEKKPRVASKAK